MMIRNIFKHPYSILCPIISCALAITACTRNDKPMVDQVFTPTVFLNGSIMKSSSYILFFLMVYATKGLSQSSANDSNYFIIDTVTTNTYVLGTEHTKNGCVFYLPVFFLMDSVTIYKQHDIKSDHIFKSQKALLVTHTAQRALFGKRFPEYENSSTNDYTTDTSYKAGKYLSWGHLSGRFIRIMAKNSWLLARLDNRNKNDLILNNLRRNEQDNSYCIIYIYTR